MNKLFYKWKNIVFFHVCLIKPITSLAFHATRPGWWINGERFTKVHLIQGRLSEFFWIMVAKTLKIRFSFKQWRSNFSRWGWKRKQGKKYESYQSSGFGNGISRGWERKSTTERFAPGRFWPCTWKISFILYFFFRRKPFATTRFDYQINEVHFKLSYAWSKITSNRDKIRL